MRILHADARSLKADNIERMFFARIFRKFMKYFPDTGLFLVVERGSSIELSRNSVAGIIPLSTLLLQYVDAKRYFSRAQKGSEEKGVYVLKRGTGGLNYNLQAVLVPEYDKLNEHECNQRIFSFRVYAEHLIRQMPREMQEEIYWSSD